MSSRKSNTPTDDAPPINGALALRIATRFYGPPHRLRWIRSDEVDVFVAEYRGEHGQRDKVLKLDRPGKRVAAQEQRLLPFLRDAGIEVPPVEQCGFEPLGDAPGATADAPDTVAFIVQPFLERRGIGAIYAEDVGAARDVAKRLGRSAARLHALPPATVPGGSDPAATRYWFGRAFLVQHARYRESFPHRSRTFDAVCDRAEALLTRLPTHFGNGQGYQSLCDGRGGFAIIDWGTCGVFWRMYDLAQAVGAMDVWCRWEPPPTGAAFTCDEIASDLVPRVLAAYAGEWGSVPSDDELDELALWRAHHALMAAMGSLARGQVEHAGVRLAIAAQVLRERPGAT